MPLLYQGDYTDEYERNTNRPAPPAVLACPQCGIVIPGDGAGLLAGFRVLCAKCGSVPVRIDGEKLGTDLEYTFLPARDKDGKHCFVCEEAAG